MLQLRALQLQATNTVPVLISFNYNVHAEFKVVKPIHCSLIAFFTVDASCYVMTLTLDPVTLTSDLE